MARCQGVPALLPLHSSRWLGCSNAATEEAVTGGALLHAGRLITCLPLHPGSACKERLKSRDKSWMLFGSLDLQAGPGSELRTSYK